MIKSQKSDGKGGWRQIFNIIISIDFSQFMNKVIDFALYILLVLFLINIIGTCVDCKDRSRGQTLQPLLMPLMNFFQIVQCYALLSLTVSLLYSLQTKLWRTFQVYYSFQWTLLHHSTADIAIDSILSLIQISLPIHDLSKHKPISLRRPLRVKYFTRLFSNHIIPQLNPRMNRIQLKSKCPSFWVFIVILEYVDSIDIGPLLYGLFDGFDLKK